MISDKCGVPVLYRFELAGTETDIDRVRAGLAKFWGDDADEGGVKGTLDYHALNAMLNLYDGEGKIRFDADRMAARQYFLQHVNQNTVFFHSLDEKLDYLVEEGYYEAEVLDQYSKNFQRAIWDAAYRRSSSTDLRLVRSNTTPATR